MGKKMEKDHLRIFIEVLSQKPVAFAPLLGKIAKSATAGLLMSQLLFWWDKGRKEGKIYKTIEEILRETCLTRHEQATAIKKWQDLRVLTMTKEGVPPIRHFQIDTKRLYELATKAQSNLPETANQYV